MEVEQTIRKRLYKSRQNRVIDGVCGGIGEYFEVDPTIVRVLWVLMTLLGGSGLVLYLIAMVIMPVNQEHLASAAAGTTAMRSPDRRSYWGIILILIGLFVLIDRMDLFVGFSWWDVSRRFLFPISLIAIGLMFIYIHTRRQAAPQPAAQGLPGFDAPPAVKARELRRSIHDKKICGVCGGLAQYFEYDSTLIRILFVFLVLASFGWGLLLYVILCLLIPEDKTETVSA
jgi:phage shock protein PspC (stress-responsive transcriptional regulator)